MVDPLVVEQKKHFNLGKKEVFQFVLCHSKDFYLVKREYYQ